MLRATIFFICVTFAAVGAQAANEVLVPNSLEGANRVLISVRDQKMALVQNGERVAIFRISTSKYGLGDDWGHMTTPLGFLQVAEKIGDNAPSGAVFHHRRFTGEIVPPNAPGRDTIVTRIIWLRGLEASNAHAFSRCIYIHGTPEEKTLGRPASYGCIRMKSVDVTALYDQLPVGAVVQIVPDKLPKMRKAARGSVFIADVPKLSAAKSTAVVADEKPSEPTSREPATRVSQVRPSARPK